MEQTPILHDAPAERAWRKPHTARLPGTVPVAEAEWLRVDAAYGAQMAARVDLLRMRRDDVLACPAEARPLADELYADVVQALVERGDFAREDGAMRCPDGRLVPLDADAPLWTLGHLVQEDFCLLAKAEGADEHRLVGAVLVFPAGWTLAEKLGRPLGSIHVPVAKYDAAIAARVQRLCDGLQAGRPLLRANFDFHLRPDLFSPRRESDPPRAVGAGRGDYLRVERQVLRRLPQTGGIVFSIHTSMTPCSKLSEADLEALAAHRPGEA